MTYRSPLMGLVRLMAAYGGEIDDRIRLQKSAFILKHLGFADFAKLRFSSYYRGPYSRQLSDVLHELVVARLIAETREAGDDHARYSYRLTAEGRAWLSTNNVEASPDLIDCVQVLKKSHWRTLELASTMLYLLDEQSDLEQGRKQGRQQGREEGRSPQGPPPGLRAPAVEGKP